MVEITNWGARLPRNRFGWRWLLFEELWTPSLLAGMLYKNWFQSKIYIIKICLTKNNCLLNVMFRGTHCISINFRKNINIFFCLVLILPWTTLLIGILNVTLTTKFPPPLKKSWLRGPPLKIIYLSPWRPCYTTIAP